MIFFVMDFGSMVAAVIVFVILITLLSAMLIYARTKLVSQDDVRIVINGDVENPLLIKPGSSLLNALSTKNIFLPSACGGGGTCAMCECHIDKGGGDVLPTEMNHLSRKEVAENMRLSCQVKVREDMEIRIPEEIFGIKKWECEVVSNYNVATFIKEFKIEVPFKDMDIAPLPDDPAGPDKYRSEWDKFGLWPLSMKNDEEQFRAYSMANVCSSYVFGCKPGDKVTISGPYGEFFIKPSKKEMVYIGGGAGMAPLRSHIFHLFHTEKTRDRKVSYWYGGRSKRELFYTDHFRKIEDEYDNFQYHIALSDALEEDNWVEKKSIDDPEGDGFTGFIHLALLNNYLKDHEDHEDA